MNIYLFGTIIIILLIGLGAALVYRKMNETVTAVKSPLRLPDMIEALGRAVGTQTVAIHRNLDNNMEKLTALQRKLDRFGDLLEKEKDVQIGMLLLARPNNPNLICFRPPQPARALANNNSPEERCSETLLHSLPPSHRHLWIVVSVRDLIKAVSMATTILRTENLIVA